MPEAIAKEKWYQKRLEAMKAGARASAQEQAISAGTPTTASVSPFDPDFLLMLMFAAFNDILDPFKDALIAFFGISEIVGTAFDVFTFAIIGFWIYQRTSQIIKSKKQQVEAMQKKIGKTTAQMQKQLTKMAKKPVRRALLRGGIALLGEIAPFIGILPFWTITVILMLREKGG